MITKGDTLKCLMNSELPFKVATAWIILAIELNLFYHTLAKIFLPPS